MIASDALRFELVFLLLFQKDEIHVCDMIQTDLDDDEKQNVYVHFGFLYYSKASAMCIKKRDICGIICLKRESSQDYLICVYPLHNNKFPLSFKLETHHICMISCFPLCEGIL